MSKVSARLNQRATRNGRRIGILNIAIITSVLLITFGGLSSAWAGHRTGPSTNSSLIYSTGFSILAGPGGFQLHIRGPRPIFYPPRVSIDIVPRYYNYPGKYYGKRHWKHHRRHSHLSRGRHHHHHHHHHGHSHGRWHSHRGRW